MSTPPRLSSDHVARALTRFTSMFSGRVVIEGLLKSYIKEVQQLENAVWGVLTQCTIETNFDNMLNMFGALVGEPRNGRSNLDFREGIRLRIIINRSTGKTDDLITIIALSAKATAWYYWTAYPAGFSVLFTGTVSAFYALHKALKQAKAGGVGGGVLYSTLPTNQLFVYGWTGGSYAGGLPPRGYATAISPNFFVSTLAHVRPL